MNLNANAGLMNFLCFFYTFAALNVLILKSMKKVFLLFLALGLFMSVGASNMNGRRVVMRPTANGWFSTHRPHRVPAKELVSLYQENDILHINAEVELMMTITIKDEEGNVLSQTIVYSSENDVVVPTDGIIVEVSYNDIDLVGILY